MMWRVHFLLSFPSELLSLLLKKWMLIEQFLVFFLGILSFFPFFMTLLASVQTEMYITLINVNYFTKFIPIKVTFVVWIHGRYLKMEIIAIDLLTLIIHDKY